MPARTKIKVQGPVEAATLPPGEATRRQAPAAAIVSVQARSSLKRDRVRIVLQRARELGIHMSKAEVARRCDPPVSRDLIDAMQDEYDAVMQQITADLSGKQRDAGEVSTASLRAQLEHYKMLYRHEEQKVKALEKRLGILYGNAITGEVVAAEESHLERRVAELEGDVGALTAQLAEAEEQLQAAQQANARLMKQNSAALARARVRGDI